MNTHKRKNTAFALVKSLLLMGLLLGMATTGYSEQSITYIYTDHLGSPIKAINPTTGETWTEDYQPYGTKRLNQDGDNSVGYTGHRHEKSLNVTYMQGRWYHPGMGRFLALDPVRFVEGNPASFNRYAYANNNPYKYVDPDGRMTRKPSGRQCLLETGGCISGGGRAPGLKSSSGSRGGISSDGGDVVLNDRDSIKKSKARANQYESSVTKSAKNNKRFSDEKQALVDMAKKDKKTGMTADDMQAYKDLNKELPDPFPSNKVRGPEVHPNRPHGKEPHGHVGPVDHIPIKDK